MSILLTHRLMISPTRPLWTPSGLIMMKLLSRPASWARSEEKGAEETFSLTAVTSGLSSLTWVSLSWARPPAMKQAPAPATPANTRALVTLNPLMSEMW